MKNPFLPVFVPPVKIHAPVVLAAFNNPLRISYKSSDHKSHTGNHIQHHENKIGIKSQLHYLNCCLFRQHYHTPLTKEQTISTVSKENGK